MLFKQEPADFKSEMDVVGCFMQHDGKFVLLLRQDHKVSGNTWGVPAGKVDASETPRQAMAREIFEETGLAISESSLVPFGSMFEREIGHDFVYHQFSTQLIEKPEVKVRTEEHKDFKWVTPQEALKMNLIHDEDTCIELFYF